MEQLNMPNGHCKLTGLQGRFISAHLIPKALTKPEREGASFVQIGRGTRPVRRWSSWYDQRLVIREGEDILTKLDTWAISELRRRQLVWSGWGPMVALAAEHTAISGTPWGIREIHGIDGERLRLFVLSLLWRAAATKRPEFSEVIMSTDDLEELRQLILAGDPGRIDFYPATMIQISTLGTIHNMPPIAETKIVPEIDGEPRRELSFFRFYFDGLIIHILRQASDSGYSQALQSSVVGAGRYITLSTVTYEVSFERENLNNLLKEASELWPTVMTKL